MWEYGAPASQWSRFFPDAVLSRRILAVRRPSLSHLAPLFALLENTKADELRLTPDAVPFVIMEGVRRDVSSQPVNARLILAAASELLPHDDLRDLPSQRPRMVRHEHADVHYIIEIWRENAGLGLRIRPAHKVRADDSSPHRKPSNRTPESPAPAPASNPAPAFVPSEPAPRPVSTSSYRPATSSSGPRVDALLREMLATKASDLHLSANNVPVMRVHGEIHFASERGVLSSADVRSLVEEIMPEKARKDFAELHDADFAHEIPGLARFRVNVFEDRNGVGSVMRQIPIEVLTVEQLGLPKACVDLCWLSKGLVVVTGPTGSGKSTTLAAMIDYINKNRSDHIITIEDPVEFVHKNVKCLVNQREVGHHTKSFKAALRAALREDPDIVLVGEMRDLETISIAIETAETGHLVFGTLHTTTATSTVDRIIDQFPTDRQAQIRVMLSESLKGVIAQVLCKKVGGGRVAAHEILLGNSAVTNLIRDGKTFQLPSVMQTSKNAGMVTMNDSMLALVQAKKVDPKEAWLKATDKAGLLTMFKNAGMSVSVGG